MKKVSNLVGETFNRLTVVSYLGKRNHGKHWWGCSCSCGGYIELNTSTVKNGYTKSCGCIRKEKLILNRACPDRHGLHKHKLYAVYYAMLGRCDNPKSQRFKYYGGKGIDVCDDWRFSFEYFYEWAIESGYKHGLSIDRIDSDGDYTPRNCQWVTVSENTRRAHEGKSRG